MFVERQDKLHVDNSESIEEFRMSMLQRLIATRTAVQNHVRQQTQQYATTRESMTTALLQKQQVPDTTTITTRTRKGCYSNYLLGTASTSK